MKSTEKKQSEVAPEQWVDEYGDLLFNYCIARVDKRELALDLVQETLLTAFEKYDNFQNKSKVSTWLTAILKNKIIDHYRSQKLNAESIEDLFFNKNGTWEPEAQTKDGLKNILETLEKSEQNEQLHRCIESLGTLQKSVLKLKYFKEYNGENICKELDISSSNLWVLVHRAKLKVRKCIEDKKSNGY